ncbi:MAG: polyprenyl synthetase family protein [Thermoplasmata archaeon]
MTSTPREEAGELSFENLVSRSIGSEPLGPLHELLPVLAHDLTDVDWRLQEILGARYATLTEAARYACSTGGKRVRPLLMAAYFRALGSPDTSRIHSLAAAFQLIHTASLVHDDVIDHADARRGRPSMPRAYGLPLSIVTGDYLFVRAFELAAEYPKSIILRCGEACADLVEGEVLQEAGRFDLSTGRDHYLRVVERKTAAIVAAALGSCAELTTSDPEAIDAAMTFGRSLGVAFQIRDDLLDVFGDPDLMGKPLYADFREGNPTLVSLVTYERLDSSGQAEFERIFQTRRKRARHLLRLRELAEEAGAHAVVEAEARSWADRASRSLVGLPESPYRALLERLARATVERPS